MRTNLFLLFLCFPFLVYAQSQYIPQPMRFPDISGYKTLKCDFHIHTVFSDGLVWPTIRVDEAMREGLDAIAITDHIEYHPHDKDIPLTDLNRSYEIARDYASNKGVVVIHGSEITRSMPPGHLNALFIQDGNKLRQDDPLAVVREAKKQGGWIFWNHPMWVAQKPDGVSELTDMHRQMLKEGLIDGIEIVNELSFSDEAIQIGMKNNLTLMGNSDLHGIAEWIFAQGEAGHRPVTLVFATEKSENAIHEALQNRRTVVWYENTLAGREEYLVPLIQSSLQVVSAEYTPKTTVVSVVLENLSDADFQLENAGDFSFYNHAAFLTVKAHEKTVLEVKTLRQVPSFQLSFKVFNAVTATGDHPRVAIPVNL